MQGRAGKVHNRHLQGIEAIVQWQQRVLTKGKTIASSAGVKHGRPRGFRSHRGVVDEGLLTPLGDGLVVQPIALCQLLERSLRSLYRSSDGVRGRGAAVEYMAHSASRIGSD